MSGKDAARWWQLVAAGGRWQVTDDGWRLTGLEAGRMRHADGPRRQNAVDKTRCLIHQDDGIVQGVGTGMLKVSAGAMLD